MENSPKQAIVLNTLNSSESLMEYENFVGLKESGGYSHLQLIGLKKPDGALPCWYISNDERLAAKKLNSPYAEHIYNNQEYFLLYNRINDKYIEGFIGRNDRQLNFLNDVMERYTYLIDYYEKKKVYFTFDRINLYELVELFPNHPNPIRFMLKRLDSLKNIKQNQAFMIMPFHDKELDVFYINHVKDFLTSRLKINVYRADDFRNNDIIVDTIYQLIEESEFVIADTTKENKNSFYELGYASALGKEIITIQNKTIEQKLFFDRAHIRSILYDPADIPTFEFELQSTIESIRTKV
jgi:nucleoside 2-deoxyribosyltransferase